MNHDALFKNLLKRPDILKGFFDAFLPKVAAFTDFNRLVFVDKEGDTTGGRRRTGDLLVKTRFRGKPAAFLIHLEHQAQPDPGLGARMLEYWVMYWRHYKIPVYPIAVLSHKETAGRPVKPIEIRFPNKGVLKFDFDVIDLSRMNAESHVKIQNPAALALSMRMKRTSGDNVRFSRDFYVNLAKTRLGHEDKRAAIDFFLSYAQLTIEETGQLQEELGKVKPDSLKEVVMNLTNPFIELGKKQGLEQGLQQGLEQGLELGLQQGQAELVIRQLARLSGTISNSQEKAIRSLPLDKVEALGEALLDFTSPADLTRWLRNNKRS